MTTISRRNLLKQSPAALVIAAAPIGTAVAAVPPQTAQDENPELLAAYDRFLAARADVAAAEDALEWLVDEWRHLWPLAPEEILGAANADQYTADAERDIAGRIITRNTADLTKRFTRLQREKWPTACFCVRCPEQLQGTIEAWEKPRTGRTEKALARNRAEQARVLSEYQHKLRLSEEYFAETARLIEASGVNQVKRRIRTAKGQLDRACSDVSYEPAHTVAGLRLKAEVLQTQDEGMAPYLRDKGGALGAMALFIEATLEVIGRVSA